MMATTPPHRNATTMSRRFFCFGLGGCRLHRPGRDIGAELDQGHDEDHDDERAERQCNRERAGAAGALLLLGQSDAGFGLLLAHRLTHGHAAKWPNSAAGIRSTSS